MELHFKDPSAHPDPLDLFKIRAPAFTCMLLGKLENLTVLNLGFPYGNIYGDYNLVYVPETLKRFSSWVCSNEDIVLLSTCCKGLESLDFIKSPYVNNGCLKYLIKFRHLKELYLSGTQITQSGLTWILDALSSTEDHGGHFTSLSKQLISFGCGSPNETHINLLASRFRNLKSLQLVNVQRETRMTRLTELRYLSNLTILSSGVSEEFLQVIGYKLKCLEISLHSFSELKWIYDYCPSIECLHLFFRVPNEPQSTLMSYFERCPLPEFRSVKRLQLTLYNQDITDYIVSRFVNVKKLSVSHNGRISLFENIVQRKQLKHLEQFFWGERTVVEFSGDEAIVTTVTEDFVMVHSLKTGILCSLYANINEQRFF
jgi:hypothetical protein